LSGMKERQVLLMRNRRKLSSVAVVSMYTKHIHLDRVVYLPPFLRVSLVVIYRCVCMLIGRTVKTLALLKGEEDRPNMAPLSLSAEFAPRCDVA
ncbi:MAG: hypothetical protein ACK4TI_01475, partial [Nitrososphaerales archaeon]